MAFWGVEVKPGKPVTHYCEKARGRLRISQATLGIGDATMRSTVQCNVGRRSPVLLCVLIPEKKECCHLELEFEEADDVVFSVIGPRSVYLSGYYIQKIQGICPHSDSETLGADIENTNTEGSGYRSDDDDEYGGSFINDDHELQFSPESPVECSKGVNEEATPENDELEDNELAHGGQGRKNYQAIASDDDADSHESEDKVPHSLSASKSKSDAEEDDGVYGVDKLDGAVLHAYNNAMEEETLEETNVSIKKVLTGNPIHESNAKDAVSSQSLPTSIGNDETPFRDLEKSKRKRKKHSKEEKTHTCQADKDNTVLAEDNVHEVEASNNTDISGNPKDGLSKKRKSELQLEGISVKGTDSHCGLQQAENQTQEQPGLEQIHTDEIGEEERGEDQNQQIDNIINTVYEEILASYGQPDKRIKKKKKKTPFNGNLNMGTTVVESNNPETTLMESDDQSPNATISKGGLIIEELDCGPPDAKVAAPGKKVKIYYTAMVKDIGHVFDSNVGKDALCFRLGNEDFIDGWNVGIDGMRVGGKRRLIVPPSMAFGDNAVGEDVPPNSWLIYEIHLLSVRR
ncbi:Peptidyl-prolyl cis-trans isomerase FKBP53 [Striga hermonthica]|uniref:peptidylprolyl isomerase n=1 Tax=Striga hermonthica TaxID=68872 RepID=A0A9N7RSX8_STRHE|nr:Peptidyl-prolyl cis-trans isomerase FKBP53 [Striga hermonthica]